MSAPDRTRAAYKFLSLARGDYRGLGSSVALAEAMRVESERAETSNEKWHARGEISYALACGSIKRAPWMAPFIGERLS